MLRGLWARSQRSPVALYLSFSILACLLVSLQAASSNQDEESAAVTRHALNVERSQDGYALACVGPAIGEALAVAHCAPPELAGWRC